MFETNPHSSCKFSIRLRAFGFEKRSCSVSNSFLIVKDLTDWRPLIWDLAMGVTILWVVNIRIYATFEDEAVRARFGGRIASRSGQMNV